MKLVMKSVVHTFTVLICDCGAETELRTAYSDERGSLVKYGCAFCGREYSLSASNIEKTKQPTSDKTTVRKQGD